MVEDTTETDVSEAPRRTCVIDRSTFNEEINALLATGLSINAITTRMRGVGMKVKRDTIDKHWKLCLGRDAQSYANLDLIVRKQAEGAPLSEVERDFATMVQRRALKEMAMERLKVTTKDGLLAQQILDKRVEKAKDREFVMNLARIISGAGQLPPADVIEAEFTEGAIDDVMKMLAPPQVQKE